MNDILETLNALGGETAPALERFMGNEEMYLKYVRGFPKEPTMERLRAAVDAGDYAAAREAVHALKGIVANLGFTPLEDATVDMLAELRDDDVPAALEEYESVQKQYGRFCDAITAWQG